MLIETHQGLESFSYVITIVTVAGGVTLGGWVNSLRKDKELLEKDISAVKSASKEHTDESTRVWEKQWQRIDELRDNAAKFITREQHDNTIKDIYNAIREAMRPVNEKVDRLSDKIDRLIEGRSK